MRLLPPSVLQSNPNTQAQIPPDIVLLCQVGGCFYIAQSRHTLRETLFQQAGIKNSLGLLQGVSNPKQKQVVDYSALPRDTQNVAMLLLHLFYLKNSLREFPRDSVLNACILVASKMTNFKVICLTLLENNQNLLRKSGQKFSLNALAEEQLGKAPKDDKELAKYGDQAESFPRKTATFDEIEEKAKELGGTKKLQISQIQKERPLMMNEMLMIEKKILANLGFEMTFPKVSTAAYQFALRLYGWTSETKVVQDFIGRLSHDSYFTPLNLVYSTESVGYALVLLMASLLDLPLFHAKQDDGNIARNPQFEWGKMHSAYVRKDLREKLSRLRSLSPKIAELIPATFFLEVPDASSDKEEPSDKASKKEAQDPEAELRAFFSLDVFIKVVDVLFEEGKYLALVHDEICEDEVEGSIRKMTELYAFVHVMSSKHALKEELLKRDDIQDLLSLEEQEAFQSGLDSLGVLRLDPAELLQPKREKPKQAFVSEPSPPPVEIGEIQEKQSPTLLKKREHPEPDEPNRSPPSKMQMEVMMEDQSTSDQIRDQGKPPNFSNRNRGPERFARGDDRRANRDDQRDRFDGGRPKQHLNGRRGRERRRDDSRRFDNSSRPQDYKRFKTY